MKKTILIGGEAGHGVKKTSYLIAKSFTKSGLYSFDYQDYPSLIRGGHNFCVLKVSDKPIYSHQNKYDIIIAFDEEAIELHGKNLKKKGIIICDKEIEGKTDKPVFPVDMQEIIDKYEVSRNVANDVLVGFLYKLLGLNIEKPLEIFKEAFPKKAKEVEEIIKEGFNYSIKEEILDKSFSITSENKSKYFLEGNEAIGAGAIYAGLDNYIAYPMTPSTGVLNYLAGKQKDHNFLVVQPENEIAVANAALGSSFTGALSMVGTSGGGFALMSEALSMQGMSELPLVVYLSQRSSPASGIPTYTAQGDLKFALNAGHGEFPRVVLAPGDSKEAFYMTVEAFYLSQKYRVLSILLGDKHVAESYYSFDDFEEPKVKPERNVADNPNDGYLNYSLNEKGFSSRAVPGQVSVTKTTSYEHDEFGNTSEDGKTAVKMNEKRWRKNIYLKKEIEEKLQPVEIYGEGENLIIGWGSTKGAIIDALSGLKNYRFMQIKYLAPFPDGFVKEEIKKSNNVVLVENNVKGLLADVIREQTGHLIKKKILKYNARPFVPKDIIRELK